MADIRNIVPTDDPSGMTWGLDAESGKWVPVNQNVLQGSTVGNLGRGAVLGFQQVGQGISQMLQGSNDPNVRQAGHMIDLQSEAASNAAPLTMAMGMGAPEIAGGIAATALTGGMDIPALIGMQALVGGGIGALRPGDATQRIENAALGAVFAGGGEVLGQAATKGILSALTIGKTVAGSSEESTARGVLGAMAQREAAGARADFANAAAGIQPGQSTAGAARTPLGEMDPQTVVENQAMNAMDQTAARNPSTSGVGQILDAGRDVGIEPEWWAPSEKYGPARRLGAFDEFSPFKASEGHAEENQMQLNRLGAHAAGAEASFDPAQNTTTRLFPDVVQHMHDVLANAQRNMVANFPEVMPDDIRSVLDSVQMNPGMSDKGGKIFTKVKQQMVDYLDQNQGKPVPADTFMNQMSYLSGQTAKAAKASDTLSVPALGQLRNGLYDLIEQSSRAADGSPTVTSQGWADLRRQWQTYYMLRHGATVDKQGNVNFKSLLTQMLADRAKGGFGPGGPPVGTPQRALFDGAMAVAQNDTMQPPTGARLVGHLGRLTRGVLRDQAMRSGGLGALGYGVASSIWGSGE